MPAERLMLWVWRLPSGEPRWGSAAAFVEHLPPEGLLARYRQWEGTPPLAGLVGEAGEQFLLERAMAKARRGLAELRRACDGHPFAVELTWADGTRELAVGGDASAWGPFDGWDDLCFAAALGVPEHLGWQPPEIPSARPPAPAPQSPAPEPQAA